MCGFLAEETRYNDDCLQTQLNTQAQVLEKSNLESFKIEIGGLNSFASAPFLEVHDRDNGITRLRELLVQGGRKFRTAPYRPHLTIGLYAKAFPSADVLAQMAIFPNDPVRWRVDKITLATYQAKEIVGKLDYIYDLSLATRRPNVA